MSKGASVIKRGIVPIWFHRGPKKAARGRLIHVHGFLLNVILKNLKEAAVSAATAVTFGPLGVPGDRGPWLELSESGSADEHLRSTVRGGSRAKIQGWTIKNFALLRCSNFFAPQPL
jgi:hypothetical protein